MPISAQKAAEISCTSSEVAPVPMCEFLQADDAELPSLLSLPDDPSRHRLRAGADSPICTCEEDDTLAECNMHPVAQGPSRSPLLKTPTKGKRPTLTPSPGARRSLDPSSPYDPYHRFLKDQAVGSNPMYDLKELIRLAKGCKDARVTSLFDNYSGTIEELIQNGQRLPIEIFIKRLKMGPGYGSSFLDGFTLGVQMQKAAQRDDLVSGVHEVADSMKTFLKAMVQEHKAHSRQSAELATQVRNASASLADVVQQAEKFSVSVSKREPEPSFKAPPPVVCKARCIPARKPQEIEVAADVSDTSSSDDPPASPVELLGDDGTYVSSHLVVKITKGRVTSIETSSPRINQLKALMGRKAGLAAGFLNKDLEVIMTKLDMDPNWLTALGGDVPEHVRTRYKEELKRLPTKRYQWSIVAST